MHHVVNWNSFLIWSFQIPDYDLLDEEGIDEDDDPDALADPLNNIDLPVSKLTKIIQHWHAYITQYWC